MRLPALSFSPSCVSLFFFPLLTTLLQAHRPLALSLRGAFLFSIASYSGYFAFARTLFNCLLVKNLRTV